MDRAGAMTHISGIMACTENKLTTVGYKYNVCITERGWVAKLQFFQIHMY